MPPDSIIGARTWILGRIHLLSKHVSRARAEKLISRDAWFRENNYDSRRVHKTNKKQLVGKWLLLFLPSDVPYCMKCFTKEDVFLRIWNHSHGNRTIRHNVISSARGPIENSAEIGSPEFVEESCSTIIRERRGRRNTTCNISVRVIHYENIINIDKMNALCINQYCYFDWNNYLVSIGSFSFIKI